LSRIAKIADIAKIGKPKPATQRKGNNRRKISADAITNQILFTRIAGSATLSAIFGNFGTSGNCLVRVSRQSAISFF